MNRPRVIKWLRVAVSAGCLVVFLVVGVLWMRSYRTIDVMHARFGISQRVLFCSMDSNIYVGTYPDVHFYTLGKAPPKVVELDSGRIPTPVSSKVLRLQNSRALIVPHCLIAISAAVFAMLPWIPWSWRFSLRTMLFVTTLIAGALGLGVYLLR